MVRHRTSLVRSQEVRPLRDGSIREHTGACEDVFRRVSCHCGVPFSSQDAWVVSIRFFLRVDGALARLLDTKFAYVARSGRVLRERSWREGTWEDLVGKARRRHCGVTVGSKSKQSPPCESDDVGGPRREGATTPRWRHGGITTCESDDVGGPSSGKGAATRPSFAG